MPFTEVCIDQVKPQKAEEFETLMRDARSFLEKQEGLLLLRLVRRGYQKTYTKRTGSLSKSAWSFHMTSI